MSARGERLEGIKAYEGTIESAEQTLSFLITFIFRGRGNAAEEECARGTQRPCYPFNCTRGEKKRERIVIDTPAPKGSFKENSMLFDFSPKTILNLPSAPTIGSPPPPPLPPLPPLPRLSPTLCYRSVGFLKSEQSAEAAEAGSTINCSY